MNQQKSAATTVHVTLPNSDWGVLGIQFSQHLLLDSSCPHAAKHAKDFPQLVSLLLLLHSNFLHWLSVSQRNLH